MFEGLPKLFDRSFFIAYFLPASLLFSAGVANLFAFGYIDKNFLTSLAQNSIVGAATSVAAIWLFSILLMAFNRPVVRLIEGYGERNPIRLLLQPLQEEKFRDQAEPQLRKLNSVLDARRQGAPESEEFYPYDIWLAVNNYPEELDLVLPTRLGNIMRAYERYSDVVYGIESIVAWPRLLMIIPEQARERIREAEALFQFSVNTLFMSVITLIMSGAMIINLMYHRGVGNSVSVTSWPMIILVLTSAGFFASFSWSWLLPETARQRGEQVKSAFDLYRGKLAEALGFQLPTTESEERKMWELISRRMLMRVAEDRLRGYSKSLDDFRMTRVLQNNTHAPAKVVTSEDGKEEADAC